MIKVLFVCLGNICRSPMAEFVFKNMVKNKGLENEFFIDSKATDGGYNERNMEGIYPDTKNILRKNNIPFTEHISKEMKSVDYENFDYIIGMEEANIRSIFKYIGKDPNHKVHRLLDFTETPRDITDPWYYGNFDKTYRDINEGCQKFLDFILNEKLRD